MWTDGKSPYRIVTLTPEQEELAERIRTVMDPSCFPNTDPEDIPDLGDAAVVSESMALGAKLLLTSTCGASTTSKSTAGRSNTARKWESPPKRRYTTRT